jgi:hypothetical protein
MATPRELAELHELPDDAYLDTHEASAILRLDYHTLRWYRVRRPDASPKYTIMGDRKSVRYRMGDLRALLAGDPNAYQVPRTAKVG